MRDDKSGYPGYPIKIGEVVELFNPAKSGINVAVVQLTDNEVRTGDTISWGVPDDNVTRQVAASIEVWGKKSPITPQGSICGIAIEGDKLPSVGTKVSVTKPTEIVHRDTGAHPIRTVYQTPD